jgi:hypothetical protein
LAKESVESLNLTEDNWKPMRISLVSKRIRELDGFAAVVDKNQDPMTV